MAGPQAAVRGHGEAGAEGLRTPRRYLKGSLHYRDIAGIGAARAAAWSPVGFHQPDQAGRVPICSRLRALSISGAYPRCAHPAAWARAKSAATMKL